MKIRKYTRKNAENKYSYATAYHYAETPFIRSVNVGNNSLTGEGILFLMIPEITFISFSSPVFLFSLSFSVPFVCRLS